jgi:hypothetical protein
MHWIVIVMWRAAGSSRVSRAAGGDPAMTAHFLTSLPQHPLDPQWSRANAIFSLHLAATGRCVHA